MIGRKERAILYLLSNFEQISRIKFVKLMFITSQETELYDFIPYNYGPFSFQMYHDLARLEQHGFVTQHEKSVEFEGLEFPEPDRLVRHIISKYVSEFGDWSDKKLLDFIYQNYPDYTIFSNYEKKIEYQRDEKGIVTTGYEGESIDSFLYKLILNKVGVVIDVRKNAFSRKYGFSKNRLTNYLNNIGIEYIHMPELGVESSLRRRLEKYEDYKRLFSDYAMKLDSMIDSVERIKKIGLKTKVALICFERDAHYCHRSVIAERLREEGREVTDI